MRLWTACARGRALLPPSVGVGRRLLSSSLTYPSRLDPQLEKAISAFQKPKATLEAKTKALVDEFGMLQRVRVQRVLLVCSDYDSYTFEEEGLLNELVNSWYSEHSLSKPPVIDRVSNPELGLLRFKERGDYDMVLALSRMATSSNLIQEIVRHSPATPIGLIALTPSELTSSVKLVDESMRLNVNKRVMWETVQAGTTPKSAPGGSIGGDAWIWPFMWQGSSSLFTAMFKAVEDRLNVKADIEYGVGTILLVEDSVKFYSSYLPLLYSELWKQNQSLQGETMHARERVLRLHSRPKVLFCTNYEEAMDVYDRYRDHHVGVITDLGFPKNGVHDMSAGLQFAAHIRETSPELPVLIQTSQAETSESAHTARALGCKYISKTSKTLMQGLRQFMVDDLMFGPLQFQDGLTGQPLGSVSNVSELMQTWQQLPLSSIAYHARHSHLSRWFFARAEFELARRFRASQYPQDFLDEAGKERPDWLRNWILSEVRVHRNKLATNVENFHTADATTPIVRLGSGSLGGKGRGFRFLHNLSDKINLSTIIPDLTLVVPPCFILATSVFDEFMERNDLLASALNTSSDAEVNELFQAATLPDDVTSSLRKFLVTSSGPLAVRSSSLFEDAFMQPFAGVYTSRMVPNLEGADLDARLADAEYAVKRVYASTYSMEARRYTEAMQNRTEEEKMAVILQPLVGDVDESGRYYYPALAGVANTIDFYPRPHTRSSHGCAQVGLGLGSGVVDGLPAVHFSLGDPSVLTGPEINDQLPVAALDLHADRTDDSAITSLMGHATAALTTLPRATGVSLAPEAARVVPLTQDVHGERVVFREGYGEVTAGADGAADAPPSTPQPVGLAQVLNGEVPLAKALAFLLRVGTAGVGVPVEIEFALRLRQAAHDKHELHLLQIRPQAQVTAKAADRFQFLPSAEYAAVASARALGHGRFDGIADVVYVSPERFDTTKTAEIATEISAINSHLHAAGRKYLLMAPGRWGSANAATGIPVAWKDIDNAAFIVETQLDSDVAGKHVPVSQGSHFFQNIISFGLGYMTVDPASGTSHAGETADYAFWDAQPVEEAHQTQYVRHVRLPSALEIVVDGESRHGVVMKPGKPFDVYVSQVDAFMALAQEQGGAMS